MENLSITDKKCKQSLTKFANITVSPVLIISITGVNVAFPFTTTLQATMSITISLTIALSCLLDLLCVSSVTVINLCLCFFPFWPFEGRMWDLIV